MSETQTHNIGSIINGRYKIIEPIGKGGTGEVFVAEDLSLGGKRIALKYLKWLPAKPSALEDFKSEFATLTHLSHPHIARVYDFEQDASNQRFLFTSELIEGLEFLNAAQNMSVEQIEGLFVQSLRALEYLHGSGIFHFDIKSANLLVCHPGERALPLTPSHKGREDFGNSLESGDPANAKDSNTIKLIDFGLATIRFEGRLGGTPSYMSPEMIRRENPDGRSDLYSLGVLVYAALTGNNPFRAGQMGATLDNQLKLIPPPPSEINPDVPVYLDSIVMKLLEKRPEDRYRTAALAIRDLSLKSPKSYAVETEETRESYIPWESRFIGREKELAAIDNLLSEKRSAVVIISGAGGTGKSRLLTEIKHKAQVAEWATFILADPLRFAEWHKHAAERQTQPLLIGIDDYQNISSAGLAEPMEETCRGIAKKIEDGGAGKRHPVILVIAASDASQIGPDTAGKSAVKIDLCNFTKDEVKEYLSALTGLSNPPGEVVEQIYANTGGNPFMVTEIAKALVTEGILVDAQGRWRESTFEDIKIDLSRLQIPATVEERLLKDFAGLPDEAKKMAELLAAAGKPLSAAEASKISGNPAAHGVIMMLVRRGIARQNVTEGTYYFVRPIAAGSIYRHMSLDARKFWHDRIASVIASAGGARQSPSQDEDLLYHQGRGSDAETAKSALEKLIEIQTNAQQNRKAIENCLFYLSGWDSPKIRLALARLYNRTGNYDLAIKNAEEAGRTGKLERVTAEEIIGISHMRRRDFDAAERHFTTALEIGRELPLPQRLRIENFLAESAYFRGDLKKAVETYERTAAQTDRLSREEQLQIRNNSLGPCYFHTAQYKKAVDRLEKDISLLEGDKDKRLIAKTKYMLAESYRMERLFGRAEAVFNDLLEYSKSADDLEYLFRSYNGLGNLYYDNKRYDEAAAFYERGLDISSRLGMDDQSIACIANLGVIASNRGDMKKAGEYFQSALAFLESGKASGGILDQYHSRMHLELAEICRLDKRYDEAIQHLNEAAKIAQKSSNSEIIFWIKFTQARVAGDSGDKKAKKRFLAEALPLADTAEKKAKLKEI